MGTVGADTGAIAAVLDEAGGDDRAARQSRWSAFRILPLLGLLAVQAALAAPLLRFSTAAEDEATYLWAGRLELAHWLHGSTAPVYATYFSGAPVLYPPLGALADSIGGLAGARILSLAFMLGATALLWVSASRLHGTRAGFFAAAVFVSLGPTLHLSAYATYDAMSLFLLSLAACCVIAAPRKGDAVGWVVGGAIALVAANATKYASALFDPVVVAAAVLSAVPTVGWKAAGRRGALLAGLSAVLILILVGLGGTSYQAGIATTTTLRAAGTDTAARVLTDSWHWIAPVVVLAGVAVLVQLAARVPAPTRLLTLILAGAALLAPADQARIHTVTSLLKHVDFGAWFAAIAAGYLIAATAEWLRPRVARAAVTAVAAACLVPLFHIGVTQSRGPQFLFWSNSTQLIAVLRPLTNHGGHFLAETSTVPEYYLPDTSWQQWSSTFSIKLPSGRSEGASTPQPYISEIKKHYFSVVVLNFNETLKVDGPIAAYLDGDSSYQPVPVPRLPGQSQYYVWRYVPPRAR